MRVEGGGWRVEGGGWRVEGGGWRVVTREQTVVAGEGGDVQSARGGGGA